MIESAPVQPDQFNLNFAQLPVEQLDSIRVKLEQITHALTDFMVAVEGGPNAAREMLSWPETLSKMNLLLSHTHILTSTLTASHTSVPNPNNALPLRVLHPTSDIDAALDHVVGMLMRTKAVPAIEDAEAEILAAQPEDESLQSVEERRRVHDSRAAKAEEIVDRLRAQYEWRARVDVGDNGEEGDAIKVDGEEEGEGKKGAGIDALAKFMSTGLGGEAFLR